MFHERRLWKVAIIDTAGLLAEKLTEYTWTTCSAFAVRGHETVVFLNDSTSGDGAQEYAVLYRDLDGAPWVQVESITFGWCTRDKARAYIDTAIARRMVAEHGHDGMRARVAPRFDEDARHVCAACA